MSHSGLPRLWRTLAAGVVGLALPLVLVWQPAGAADAGLLAPDDPATMNLLASEQALLDLTNADRVANGLAPLDFDPDLLPIARERAEDQLDAPTLSHYDDSGQLVFVRLLSVAHLGFELAGENLARSSVQDSGLLPRVEQALMNSPLHRKNILEPAFHRAALGAATADDGQIAFAEVYRN